MSPLFFFIKVETLNKFFRYNTYKPKQKSYGHDLLGTLTAESWAKGEKLMSEQQREHLGDILAGNDDATTADVFLQFALMGELVYG